MTDELTELWDIAIYREIASQAFYSAGQRRTEDRGARVLLQELAKEEQKHAQRLQKFKDKGFLKADFYPEKIADLMISQYLLVGETLEGAGLQDTLALAMKREQQAVEFYSRMTGIMRDKTAKRLCASLVNQELKHKLGLEIFYDDLFYAEH